MEKMKYTDFIRFIVNHDYNTIGMENDLLENGKNPRFKIVLKRGELITGEFQYKTYYYDFDIDEIVYLMLDLIYTRDKQTRNKVLNVIIKNTDTLLKELGNDD